ncbi:MAG: hypoxanthine phosphoribosyltransferase [Armatimonadota bacterium]
MQTQADVAVLLSEEQIRQRVKELGEQISKDYAGESVLFVGILKGAAVFLADLIRAVDLPVDYDFVAISSYGSDTQSSGVVRLLKDLEYGISGRHVIIVEDIVDTGWTLRMSYIVENIKARGAASVKVCTLLDKPSRRQVEVDIHYRGFEIEDLFAVGYGLDYDGRYRNLPYIGVLSDDLINS